MKKKIWIILICIVLAAVLGFGLGFHSYHKANIKINGTTYSREITQLDLSGTQAPELEKLVQLQGLQSLNLRDTGITAAQYDQLKAALPNCRITWSVPFQGKHYADDTQTLTVTGITEAEIAQLAYFPALRSVDASECTDYESLLKLMERYPDLSVRYQVPLNGEMISGDTAFLNLTDVDAEQLRQALRYLPKMENINLEGTLPEAELLQALCADFPNVSFYWQIELFGIRADTNTKELDFSNIKMESVDTVENALGYLPSLERVIMCNCGISNVDMDALWKRNPEVRFIWSVRVGAFTLRTDVKEFMPGKYRNLPYDNQCYNLRYCVDMEALDLGHCRIYDCEFVAYMPNLKYLLLALTEISDITPIANHDKLVYLELFTCRKLKDYTPLLTLKNLEDLNICYTWGDIEIISQMTWLKNLWWSPGPENTKVIEERQRILSEALPNTYLELDTFSSTGEGWRKLQHYYEQRDIFGMPYFTY